MKITVTSARRDVGTLIEQECTLEELVEACTEYTAGDKDGEALSLATFIPCPESGCVGTGWNCGGGRDHRLSRNVRAMTGLGLDIDDLPDAAFNGLLASLRARGIMFIWWHTHSHVAGSGMTRARLLFPFREPMAIVNPRQWSAIAWPALVRFIGLPLGADFACRDPARIYYFPRKPTAESQHAAGFAPGELLDWQTVPGLAEAVAVLEAQASAVEDPIVEETSAPVDLDDVRRRLRGVYKDPRKTKIARRLLNGEALTPAPEGRPAGEPARYEAWLTATRLLARVAKGHESSELLLEILRKSWRVEKGDSPDDHTPWEKVEKLFASAREKEPAYRALLKAEHRAREAQWRAARAATLARLRSAP